MKPGEVQMETSEGPARMTVDTKGGGATVDMGKQGKFKYSMDAATMTMHMAASQVTMAGFADMLTQFSNMSGGGKTVAI